MYHIVRSTLIDFPERQMETKFEFSKTKTKYAFRNIMGQMFSSEKLNHLFLRQNYKDKPCFLCNNVHRWIVGSFMFIKKVNRVYFDFTFTVIAAILWSTKNTNLIVPAQSQ